MTSGQYGWTVALQDGQGNYECAGHDYVMDVISEKELAPGFPVCSSEWLNQSIDQLSWQSQSTDIYEYLYFYVAFHIAYDTTTTTITTTTTYTFSFSRSWKRFGLSYGFCVHLL